MANTKNILISGASVAGPAAAYWLRRLGYNPTVVERAPALRDSGNAVDFRGPARGRKAMSHCSGRRKAM
jgi:2-polyprenyl-6-methoxyphenol hydroxylase-like FAD-dependent oxidoreductase